MPYFFVERYEQSYVDQWDAFVAAFRSGSASPVSGRDGRAPLVIGMAAKRSFEEHRPVRIDEID